MLVHCAGNSASIHVLRAGFPHHMSSLLCWLGMRRISADFSVCCARYPRRHPNLRARVDIWTSWSRVAALRDLFLGKVRKAPLRDTRKRLLAFSCAYGFNGAVAARHSMAQIPLCPGRHVREHIVRSKCLLAASWLVIHCCTCGVCACRIWFGGGAAFTSYVRLRVHHAAARLMQRNAGYVNSTV